MWRRVTMSIDVRITQTSSGGTSGSQRSTRLSSRHTSGDGEVLLVYPNLEAKEECVMVLEAWKSFEQENGSSDDVAAVQEKMPRQVKRRRPVRDEHTGEEVGMEEYFDYLFPDEAGAAPLQALLAAAHKWKKRKVDEESG